MNENEIKVKFNNLELTLNNIAIKVNSEFNDLLKSYLRSYDIICNHETFFEPNYGKLGGKKSAMTKKLNTIYKKMLVDEILYCSKIREPNTGDVRRLMCSYEDVFKGVFNNTYLDENYATPHKQGQASEYIGDKIVISDKDVETILKHKNALFKIIKDIIKVQTEAVKKKNKNALNEEFYSSIRDEEE